METVTIVGTEDNLLVLATESGERFALAIDDVLHREIRRARQSSDDVAPRLAASPRDIQAQIRSGLSAKEVSELLGVSVEDVTRFEGPVLAEREHIVNQALAVPVLIGSEVEPDAQPTFGTAVRAKLTDISATDERWTSWKDESGWTVKLEFTANDVAHDARWGFDPRRSSLNPLNSDATQLSRQGALPDGLIPRLRAVDSERQESPYKDNSRFDSGAFGPRLLPPPIPGDDEPGDEFDSSAIRQAATNQAAEESHTSSDTADLLEALRRRRGQRETAPLIEEPPAEPQPIALFDTDDDLDAPPQPPQPATPAPATPAVDGSSDAPKTRKRRNTLPSWDEIVFGARTDE